MRWTHCRINKGLKAFDANIMVPKNSVPVFLVIILEVIAVRSRLAQSDLEMIVV